ncbi:hypothetical protein N7462_004517 [Penicillium macrosclerotiorum]|uniref:uncharacterized protein n=1 Tax=Penicillium macrosclerotiorum TaxID=303699 RepID=UPI002546A60D|nr:uncharacterized protein N7462_004517 [Penicillium macrosclerotiorum]KAJ5690125.1 hypothetical protein N7462_004517 [Penicillium macrosclerotiorum]
MSLLDSNQLNNPLMRGRALRGFTKPWDLFNPATLSIVNEDICLRRDSMSIVVLGTSHIYPSALAAGMDLPLLKMLELAVAEIQHQDEQVWTVKQDENNRLCHDTCRPPIASLEL